MSTYLLDARGAKKVPAREKFPFPDGTRTERGWALSIGGKRAAARTHFHGAKGGIR